MSIKAVKQDLKELKRTIGNKSIINIQVQNMTDEELLNAINQELSKIGLKISFNSLDDIPKYLLEKIEKGEIE